MADEANAGGLEAVIKVTLDDSGLEGEAQAAVERVQSVTKGKKATIKANIEIDSAQVSAEVEKKTRGKKATVKVKPVVDDADINALKQRFNLMQSALSQAKTRASDISAPKDERAVLRAAIPRLQTLLDDIPKAIARREGRPATAPSAPVTPERINDVARQVGAAMHGRPVERAPTTQSSSSSPVVVVRSSGGSTSAPVPTGRSVRNISGHAQGPGAIAQLIRQLSPTFAAFEPSGSPEIEALDAYYQALDKERGKEQRARERATPLAGLARATSRVPMERSYRRRPLRPIVGTGTALRADDEVGPIGLRDASDVLPGQVGTEAGTERYRRNRGRTEAAARRGEAIVSEDTFNPIGERIRTRAPRYSQAPIMAGEELGRPSARGGGGKRAGDTVPVPRGELGRILRQFQGRQFDDFFQPMDETGKPSGAPERATGKLAQRIKADDPKYEMFRHEERYFKRVSPKAIAASERERYLSQLSEKTKIPQLALIGLGPLGSARANRRQITTEQNVAENPELAQVSLAELHRAPRRYETEDEVKRRRRQMQRDRTQVAHRTTEDVIRFNMWLQASQSGEGLSGETGHINVGGNVLPETPTRFSPLTRMLRGSQFAPVKTTIRKPDNKKRLAKAAGMEDVTVFDPTAPSGQAKTITDTRANANSAALGRDIVETINPRMSKILEGLREGQTMVDVGPFGAVEGDVGQSQRRGSGRHILRGDLKLGRDKSGKATVTGMDPVTLSPGQTALHRFGQLLYDVTRSAGYSQQTARSYQTGRLKIGAAKKIEDPEVRTYLAAGRETIYGEMRKGRDAADALDPLQRDPLARGEKKRTWTPAYGELQELEGQLKGTPDHPGLNTRIGELSATEFANDSGPKMSPKKRDAIITEREALKKQRAKLYRRRLILRKQDEEQLAAVAAQTGGVLQGQRAGGGTRNPRGGVRGYKTKDRSRTEAIPGQTIGGIDELVPSRRASSFTEGRADSGDVFAAAVAAAASQAGTNLGETEERPAEAAIRRSKLKPKVRFKLQDTTGAATGAPPVIPVVATAAGGSGETPPPRDIATQPPAGEGGGRSLRDGVRVFVINWPAGLIGAAVAARAERADPSITRARRYAEEYDRRATAHEPGQTPAATATRLLAAQGAATPGMTAKDKQQFLREMGFTKSESSEFSGADAEKAASRAARGSTRTSTARASAFPTEGPTGPAGFTLAGEPYLADDRFDQGTKKEQHQAAKAARASNRASDREEARTERVRKAAEERSTRAGSGPSGPSGAKKVRIEEETRARLIDNLRQQGIELQMSKSERRPYSGKSPEQIASEARILEARSLNPTRAFQTAVAAAFAKTLGGGGAFEKRVKDLGDTLHEQANVQTKRGDIARELISVRKNLFEVRGEARGYADTGRAVPEDLNKLEKSLQAQRGGLEERGADLRARRGELTKEAASKQAGLITPGGVVRGFAALGAGAIVGGMVFSAAQAAIQTAITLMETQATRAADAFSGFALTTIKIAAELAGAVRQSFGNVSGAISGVAAPSGISARALGDLSAQGLSGRASAIAAAQARVQESDLFRSAGYLQKDKFPGGYDKALFQGTGGPLLGGSFMAAQPGFMERVGGDFAGLGKAPKDYETVKKRGSTGIPFIDDILLGGFESRKAQPETPDQKAQREAELPGYVADLNVQLKRANSSFSYLTNATDAQKKAMVDSAYRISDSAGKAAEQIQAKGYAIVGKGGKALTSTEYGQAASDLAVGQLTVDPQTAFEQDKRGMQAQLNQFAREQQRELTNTIPRDLALSNLAAPPKAVGAGIVAAGSTKAETAAEQIKINAGLKSATALQNDLNSRYEAGNQILKNILPPDLFKSIKDTGQAIADIQTGIAREQGALQAAEYGNQLRIAKRTLSDIAGLSGKNNGYGKSTLGVIERENVMLSRQSEILGQMLQQRQINFQLAVAGFTVAGQSPEERAARIKDAKTQAEFAQKQLNISKQTFGNNIRLFDLQNVRAATDAIASIGLLRQGRVVQIDTALAEEQLSRLNKQQADNVKRAGTYLNKIDKEVGLAYSELLKLETAYGDALNGIAQSTINGFISSIDTMYGYLNNAGKASTDPRHLGYQRGNAAGFLGTVSGATSMIMGEAGTETVAILRNPRTATLSGGGGGGITININHPMVRNDQDINKITASVVRAINTRTALLGLR